MYIHVKVVAGAKKEKFTKISADHFLISVKEEAKNNAANRRVLSVIAGHYKVPAGKVRLISGHHSPSKVLSVGE